MNYWVLKGELYNSPFFFTFTKASHKFMIRIRSKIYFVILLLGLVLFGSCLQGNFNFKKMCSSFWEPDIAIPLVSSSLTLKNILTKSNSNNNFNVGSDNFVTLVYKGTLFSVRADHIIQIPDHPYSSSYAMPSNAFTAFNNLNPNEVYNVPSPITTDFDFNSGVADALIDSLTLKSGLFNINLTSYFQHQVKVVINIPDAKKNGVAFSETIDIPPAGNGNIAKNSSFNLAGYKVNLIQGGLPNKLKIIFDISITKSPAAVTTGHNNLNINMSFADMTFKNLFGYIGQLELSPNIDTTYITLFNNAVSNGSISLKNASLGINITNSFGIPINGEFEKLQGFNPVSAVPITNITSSLFNNPLPINAPAQLGQSTNSTLLLTSANSNINNALSNLPRYLIYQINAISNPPPPAIQMRNFMEDTSRFKVDFDLNMPLEGSIKDLLFQDTIQFKFKDVEELKSLGLKIFINNGFPLDANVQIYFADKTGAIIDSLLQNDFVIASGIIGSNGKVTTATERQVEILYPEEKILRLRTVDKIYVKASTSTYNHGNSEVKVYSDYRLDVKISGRANLRFKIKK